MELLLLKHLHLYIFISILFTRTVLEGKPVVIYLLLLTPEFLQETASFWAPHNNIEVNNDFVFT